METISNLLKKVLTKEIILYIVFGVLTTLVNLGAFYIMFDILHWEENISNFIAILLAVIAAYITNKDLVFHSQAKKKKEKLVEFIKFMIGRAFTMIVEFFGCLLLFQTTIPTMISKCCMTIIVIVLNFFISKFFAFKNSKKNEEEGRESQ